MEVRFSVCNDGQVDAQLGPDRPIFNLALSDSISSLPPRGEPGNGPSTYWTNHADRGTRQAHERSDDRPFTFGNETLLCLRGDDVVAKYEYAEPDELGETMPLSDFLALLSEWRRRVEQSASTATTSLRETYRRNPASGPTTRHTGHREFTENHCARMRANRSPWPEPPERPRCPRPARYVGRRDQRGNQPHRLVELACRRAQTPPASSSTASLTSAQG